MRERLLALAERRAHLAARAQSERESMAALIARTDVAASLAVSVFHAARRVLEQGQRHPLVVVAGVALLEKTKLAAKATDDYVRDNPWQAVGIAAMAGLVLGILISRR